MHVSFVLELLLSELRLVVCVKSHVRVCVLALLDYIVACATGYRSSATSSLSTSRRNWMSRGRPSIGRVCSILVLAARLPREFLATLRTVLLLLLDYCCVSELFRCFSLILTVLRACIFFLSSCCHLSRCVVLCNHWGKFSVGKNGIIRNKDCNYL